MYSKKMSALMSDAYEAALNDRAVEVTLFYVMLEIVQQKEVKDILKKMSVDVDTYISDLKGVVEDSPKLSPHTEQMYKNMRMQRKIRMSKDLAIAVEVAERVAASFDHRTGNIEVSHFIVGVLANKGMGTGFDALFENNSKKNDFINSVIEMEAKENGLPARKVIIDWNSRPQTEQVNSGSQDYGEGGDEKYYEDLLVKEDPKPFIGRQKELHQLILALSRMDKPNVILAGEPGVGKTDIVRGLAQRLRAGNVPSHLKDVGLYSVDVAGMVAGSQFRGQFEERLKGTLKELVDMDKPPIIFIDEIHTVLGAGSSSGNSMDAANILKPYLTDGKLRVIGATTLKEYREHIEKDAAFMRRFQKVLVNEPSPAEAVQMIKESKIAYEKFHGVKIPLNAVEMSVKQTTRYLHDRFLPDKAIDVIDLACAQVKNRGEKKVTTSDIDDIVSSMCNIPKSKMEADELKVVRNLATKLGSKVFGQDEAVQIVTDAIQMSKAGLSDEGKPLGTFVFVGPSGCGKTELAKQLASELGIDFIRYDMSEFGEKHTVAKLIGAPAGYVGYDEGGLLVEQVRQKPHSVILFDEIEKAHPDVYKVFLQIFDYGMLTDSKGRKADFRNCVIIMTSNAGNSNVEKHVGFNQNEMSRYNASMEALSKIMPPELRGRISDFVVFNQISDEVAVKIVRKELNTLKTVLAAKGLTVTFSDALVAELKRRGISSEYGARSLQRVIEKEIKTLFVKKLLGGKTSSVCCVDYVDGKFVVDENVMVCKIE